MNRPTVFVVAVLATTPIVVVSQQPDLKGRQVTFRACVGEGIPKTAIRLTQVTEIGNADATPIARPLQVVYWIDKSQEPKLREHFGSQVEVTARIADLPGITVEELGVSQGVFAFEMKVPPSPTQSGTASENPVGTSGMSPDEEYDSRVLKIDVEKVRLIGTACP